MRGRVLLVDAVGRIDIAPLREAGLMVYEIPPESAVELVWDVDPDVVVLVSPFNAVSAATLRDRLDHATSIIAVGAEADRESSRPADVDAFLMPSADLVYEIHRALILRRSGRRL